MELLIHSRISMVVPLTFWTEYIIFSYTWHMSIYSCWDLNNLCFQNAPALPNHTRVSQILSPPKLNQRKVQKHVHIRGPRLQRPNMGLTYVGSLVARHLRPLVWLDALCASHVIILNVVRTCTIYWGKLLIHGPKHHKDNWCLSPKHPCWLSWFYSINHDVNEEHGHLFNPFLRKNTWTETS